MKKLSDCYEFLDNSLISSFFHQAGEMMARQFNGLNKMEKWDEERQRFVELKIR